MASVIEQAKRPATPIRQGLDRGARPSLRGKFIFIGETKLFIRGVTYGTFRPGPGGHQFPAPETVEKDFALMVANGVNALRTYTMPALWLLNLAQKHGLFVMAGLAWEQHIAFLSDPKRVRSIKERLRPDIRSCGAHPAILCNSIGNEIPAPVVRWFGRHRVEKFLKELHDIAKDEDPGGLVTYVNYPSTEYLRLPSGATLTTNGVLVWRPAVVQANTTNSVSVKVADSGTPVLTATQNFLITINPIAVPGLKPSVTNGQLSLNVSGDFGPDYLIQTSTNLFDWSPVVTNNSPTLPFVWSDTNSGQFPVRFYRVVLRP